jgi:hypothetical protein
MLPDGRACTVRIIAALFTILSIIAVACPAKAQAPFTGIMLHEACTAANAGNEFGEHICLMWITGLVQGMYWSQELADFKKLPSATCLPVSSTGMGVTGEQARLIVEKYMRDHPERLNASARSVAGAALDQAFPCARIPK